MKFCIFWIERDLWEHPNIILQEETPCCANYFVTFQLLVIQTLSPQQLEAETPYRNFEIIVLFKSFDVKRIDCLLNTKSGNCRGIVRRYESERSIINYR